MRVMCDSCSFQHEMSPTRMRELLEEYQQGLRQIVTQEEIKNVCLLYSAQDVQTFGLELG